MPYKLRIPESTAFGKGKYRNDKGNTECVEFVRQTTGAPETSKWRRGMKVADAKVGDIAKGTAIQVLDQWNGQGEVKKRLIWFGKPAGTRRSNDADTFYVIE